MNIVTRNSTESDRCDIIELVASSFGIRYNATEGNLDDRYILAVDIDCNKIVGMTGLSENKHYISRWEADYTCVLPEYRKKGIGSLLVKALIKEAKSQNITKLYWSAWVKGNGVSEVESLLRKYGFVKILNPRISYMVGHNCSLDKTSCVHCTGNNCKCSEDLWAFYIGAEGISQ